MTRLKLRLLSLLGFLCIWINAHSEGVLIFEISDAQNKPVADLQIEISQNGTPYKTYTTDASGRLVDPFIPAGDYNYSFPFGDLSQGSFSVKDGDYSWINLDYRTWTFSFKDDEGKPLVGKKASIYTVADDGTETLISEKMSDEAGTAEFLVPEGNYKYSTFKGTGYQQVQDENINTTVDVTSGEITHQTHFCFINDKKENLTVFAKDILVTHIAPDSIYMFGSVDAHSSTISHGYYLYNTTESHVSCPAGTYTCSVETQDYGTIVDTFVVDDNDPLTNNIVYIVLPTLPDTTNGGGGEGEGSFQLIIPDTLTPATPYKLKVYAIQKDDRVTPIENAMANLRLSNDYTKESDYQFTNDSGYVVWFVGADTFDIAVINDTVKNVIITQDTTIYVYVDPSNMTKVYFDFYLGDKKFDPVSVEEILIWVSQDEGRNFTLTGERVWSDEDSVYYFKYDKPIVLPHNRYAYSLYMNEKDYHRSFINDFSVRAKDTAIHNKTILQPFYTLNIVMKDINGYNFESRQYIEVIQFGYKSKLVTDSLGFYTGRHITGDYTFIAFEDTQRITLTSDTILYFHPKALISQKVKFQFLHDGKLVYPQIMNMDVYTSEGKPYSKTVSHFHEEYNGNNNVWVFDEPTICEPNDYYVEYVLKDYLYDGTFQLNFNISPSLNPDTIIYIVVPVKRSVNITIKDANLDLVTGVFGNIYKYDENGVLLTSTDYDNDSHAGLRTNSDGKIIDHLVPGRYQLRILDIVRDFIVKDYDLSFEIISGTKMYDVKYIVMYETSRKPADNLLLDVTKDDQFYNTTYTDQDGKVEIFCEEGNYAYFLHYNEGYNGSYYLKNDTTIYLYIKDPVKIESMDILGCACMTHNDSIPLRVNFTPADATLKEIEWSIDNEIIAHVTSEGVLVTHDVEKDGFIAVTATSKDGSGTKVTRKFFVGNGNCGPEQKLHYVNTTDTDIPLVGDTVKLYITAEGVDDFTHVYIYQASADSIKWSNLYGPTEDTVAIINASTFKSDMYFRALVANSVEDAEQFAKSDSTDCGSNIITNLLSLRLNKLIPNQWPDSICSTQKEVTYSINKEKIGTIADGYKLVWSSKLADDADYTHLDFDGADSITIDVKPNMSVKASLQKGDTVALAFEGTLFVEEDPSFTLKSSKDTVCRNDEVTLTATQLTGEPSKYIWSNGMTDTAITVQVDAERYSVRLEPRYGLCTAKTDTIQLTIDEPIDFELTQDKEVICASDSNGITLSIQSSVELGLIAWDDSTSADTLHVTPKENGTHTATVQSIFNKCPSVTKEISYQVRQPLAVTISTDKDDICQEGADSITVTAETLSGKAESYIWWDGKKTTENERTFKPQTDMEAWVYISDNVCPDSEKDSISITVSKPATIQLSSTNKVFEYGSDINLVADTSSVVRGPYSWYYIDAEGDKHLITISDELNLANMPNGDVTYQIEAENGACPQIESNSIKVALVDNIVIPTVFTPYTVDGENDDFMPGYKVIIYDRYGDIVCNSNDGWDGYYKGALADPGVYIYVLTLKDERVLKGTIEIFRK